MSDSRIEEPLPAAVEQGYTLLREGCGLLTSSPLQLIRVTGEDRKVWLQGQITNDMRQLEPGGMIQACMCAPTGQMIAVLKIWSLDDAYFIECHRDMIGPVLQRFSDMVIMEDVAAEPLLDWTLLSVQGPEATRWLSGQFSLPSLDVGMTEFDGVEALALRADHSGRGGWDLWVAPAGKAAVKEALYELEPIDDEALRIAQLESGIPRWGQDMNEKTLPPEMGPAFEARTISYTKGCYTGQEVLMRIHSRGHTNKTWVGLLIGSVVAPGSAAKHVLRQDAGVVTASGVSPSFGPIAAAMIRNEVAEDGETVWIGEVAAEIHGMPLIPPG